MNAQQGSAIILHESLPDDARPDELDTLQQVREVSAALEALGWQARSFGVDLDLRKTMSTLQDGDADLVFNLVESLGGCGQLIAVVPSILGAAGLRHTGSGTDAIYLSSQKVMAKRWMMLHGIPTPSWVTANGNVGTDGRRWIVKSVWEHASLGIDEARAHRPNRSVLRRPDVGNRRANQYEQNDQPGESTLVHGGSPPGRGRGTATNRSGRAVG